jgi:hypothetical protein
MESQVPEQVDASKADVFKLHQRNVSHPKAHEPVSVRNPKPHLLANIGGCRQDVALQFVSLDELCTCSKMPLSECHNAVRDNLNTMMMPVSRRSADVQFYASGLKAGSWLPCSLCERRWAVAFMVELMI